MNKSTRIVKRALALFLVVLMSINTFGAVVGDNDGSAFITKAEFDSLKNDFQSQIDKYNTSIDSKIDGAIASYLAGISIESVTERNIEIRNYEKIYSLDLESDENKWKFAYPSVDARVYQVNRPTANVSEIYLENFRSVGNAAWQGYTVCSFGRDAIPGRALLVNKINKIANTAEYAGISDGHYWDLFCRSTNPGAITPAVARNILHWCYAGSGTTLTNWISLETCSLGSQIACVKYLFEGEYPDGQPTAIANASRKWELNYINWHDEHIIRQASIIWTAQAENKFEVLDEDLGFGNEIPDYSDNVPADTLFTRWSHESIGCVFLKNPDDPEDNTIRRQTIDSTMVGLSGDDVSYDNTMSQSITYTNNKVWPGRHFCSDYITNWNQLYQPLWGKMYTDDGSYLKLIDGFPLVTVNKNERVEYKIEFDENEEFEIIAKASPFGNSIDRRNLLNISSDNHNWGKECTVVKNGTLYFDFIDKNTLSKNATVIYIKWHKVNSTNNYNGGGTLNLTTNNTVKVTS